MQRWIILVGEEGGDTREGGKVSHSCSEELDAGPFAAYRGRTHFALNSSSSSSMTGMMLRDVFEEEIGRGWAKIETDEVDEEVARFSLSSQR